jgi:hypothetical protein
MDPIKGKSSGLSGFVSFMKRRDAGNALREFDGIEWGGCVLKVGWSKAVPVAQRAKYRESRSYHRTISVLIFSQPRLGMNVAEADQDLHRGGGHAQEVVHVHLGGGLAMIPSHRVIVIVPKALV